MEPLKPDSRSKETVVQQSLPNTRKKYSLIMPPSQQSSRLWGDHAPDYWRSGPVGGRWLAQGVADSLGFPAESQFSQITSSSFAFGPTGS